MTASRRNRRAAREESGRIWQVVLGILAVCAIVLAVVYTPEAPVPVSEPGPEARPEHPGPAPDTVRVMVCNGSGIDGKGREIQRHLEGRGGGVFFVAPASARDADRNDYRETVIVSHVPGTGAAAAVAERLGVPDSSIVWSLPCSGQPEVDVTVYIGRDLAGRTFMPVTAN